MTDLSVVLAGHRLGSSTKSFEDPWYGISLRPLTQNSSHFWVTCMFALHAPKISLLIKVCFTGLDHGSHIDFNVTKNAPAPNPSPGKVESPTACPSCLGVGEECISRINILHNHNHDLSYGTSQPTHNDPGASK